MQFRYSALATAYKCFKKYEIEYVLGEKADTKDVNMEFGTALHLALSSFMETKDYEHAISCFNMYWDSCSVLDFSKSRDSFDVLRNKGDVFLTRFIRLHAKNYVPTHIEQTLTFSVGEHAFSGTPDFIGTYKDSLSIVDYKTSATKYDPRKIVINEQMYLYAHAAKQQLGLDVKQLVYTVFVKQPEPMISQIVHEVTPEKIEKVLTNVKMMCDDLVNRTKFPMNKESCLYCPHYNKCNN